MTLRLGSFLNDVRGAVLTGLSTATNSVVAATDGILVAIGKLQAQVLAPTHTGTVKQTISGLTPGYNLTQSGSGTATFANFGQWPHAGYAYNYKLINVDQVVLGADQFTNGRGIVLGEVVDHVISGTSVNGARVAHGAFMRQTGSTGQSGSDYIGASWHFALAAAPINGSTVSAPIGAIYATNPQVQLYSGAGNWVSVMGVEVDVEVNGANAGLGLAAATTQYKWGVCVTTIGADSVHGSIGEAALHIGAVATTNGWNNGILFSDFNGGQPISSAGTLMSGHKFGSGSLAVTSGIDLNAFSFSAYAFRSPNFSVDGAGNVNGVNAGFAGVTIGSTGLTVNGPIGAASSLSISSPAAFGAAVTFGSSVLVSDTGNTLVNQLAVSATSNTSNGASIKLTGNGATTPAKTIRVKAGAFDILNNAGSSIFSLSDAGTAVFNVLQSSGAASFGTTLAVTSDATIGGAFGVTGLLSTVGNASIGATLSAADLNVASTGAIAGAWNTSFTPAISPYLGTGSFGTGGNAPTATLRYKKIGRIVLFEATVTFAAASQGTASGTAGVAVTLPFAPAVTTVAFGRENVVNGKLLQGLIVSGGSTMNVVDYANAYPGTSGSINNCVLLLSGTYEASS